MPAPRTKANPRDYTGRQKQILAEQHADELSRRQDEIAMINTQAKAGLENPIELDARGRETTQTADSDVTPQDPQPVQVQPEWATIRVNCDLEHVTIGQGNDFDFKEGQIYRVPYFVAAHLERLGYVWQWL